jgi:hypothetical protein
MNNRFLIVLFLLLCEMAAPAIAQPVLSSSLTPPAICTGTLFSYDPMSTTPGTTFAWSRAFVSGIGLLPSVGSGNPNEVLINNTSVPVSVVYVYTLTAGSATNTESVTVIVKPKPQLSSDLTDSVCNGTEFVYIAGGVVPGTTFAWSRGPVTGISNPSTANVGNISENLDNTTAGQVVVVYTYVLMANGCSNTQYLTVSVNPMPTAGSVAGSADMCIGDTITFTADAAGGMWSATNGAATVSASGNVMAVAAGTDTVIYTVANAWCAAKARQQVNVIACAVAVAPVPEVVPLSVFPNPASGVLLLHATQPGRFCLYATDGRVLLQRAITVATTSVPLPKDIRAGVYIGSFAGNDGSRVSLRLMVE